MLISSMIFLFEIPQQILLFAYIRLLAPLCHALGLLICLLSLLCVRGGL